MVYGVVMDGAIFLVGVVAVLLGISVFTHVQRWGELSERMWVNRSSRVKSIYFRLSLRQVPQSTEEFSKTLYPEAVGLIIFGLLLCSVSVYSVWRLLAG